MKKKALNAKSLASNGTQCDIVDGNCKENAKTSLETFIYKYLKIRKAFSPPLKAYLGKEAQKELELQQKSRSTIGPRCKPWY